jgi:tRNA (mo5U34)-methyltransferase
MTDLAARANALHWYHTIELGQGVVTKGNFDTRATVPKVSMPADLSGKRCLDIGTWDGFWAFEMERRGAAEVVALDLDDERDLDWPPRRRPAEYAHEPRGDGFRLAKEILGSRVERVNLSVYHATPEELGTFDLVFCGSVLLRLRDQVLALERIASLTRDLFISAEEHDRASALVPFPVARYHADREKAVVFWLPSARTWRRMLWTAGFDDVTEHGRFKMRSTAGFSVPHVVHHARKGATADGR